ncbi:MAG: hypothetical protein EWV85_10300 [Microcystis aeruginosa Ma_QC_C_20070703_M131]|uniref:Uncharacterized protein n=1 Tax=Microcystis aeruginosa Ma_QC_C_20070703_M131 TaxID=2486263 RepID=A0A551Y1P9_MICAE|nr:MAG: hypothetical protein EWV85_10300 [Microcystis aeruginosa Ma_QC_C_20070703_M131]
MSDIELPVVRGYSAALSSVSRATPLVPDSLCTLTALRPIHAAGSGRNTGGELEKLDVADFRFWPLFHSFGKTEVLHLTFTINLLHN